MSSKIRATRPMTATAFALLTVLAAACTLDRQGQDTPPSVTTFEAADLVLTNATVFTVDDAHPWAEAVAIRDGRVTAVGTSADIASYIGPDTEVRDLDGQLVLPGFQDSHIHIEEASSPTFSCLVPGNTPPPALVAKIHRCRPGPGVAPWVLGWGFSIDPMIDQLNAGGPTPAEILDRAIPDRPVVIMERTSHSAWANSLALKLAGYSADSENPPGGIIVRSDDGRPNGLLLDSAGDHVFDVPLARTDRLVDVQYRGLRWGLGRLAKYGITSVADARVYWKRADLEVWQRAEAEGTLTARATIGLWAYPDANDDHQIAKLASMYDPNPDGLLHVSQIKLYSDGITLNGTAAMLAPYEPGFLRYIGPLGIGSTDGINYFDERRLTRYVTELERVGFDMHIHVLGDRGVREALDAIESAIETNGPDLDRRHRLTHNELVDPADIPRYAELGVIADAQVAGEWTQPEAWADSEPIVGDRADDFIPIRSLFDAGARVTLSSDWDVSSMDPLVGIQHAVTRTPENLPSLADAIRAYTLTPAYTLRQEDTTGSIEVGKFADLVVIDRNLFEIASTEISRASVVLTLLAGEEIYST